MKIVNLKNTRMFEISFAIIFIKDSRQRYGTRQIDLGLSKIRSRKQANVTIDTALQLGPSSGFKPKDSAFTLLNLTIIKVRHLRLVITRHQLHCRSAYSR